MLYISLSAVFIKKVNNFHLTLSFNPFFCAWLLLYPSTSVQENTLISEAEWSRLRPRKRLRLSELFEKQRERQRSLGHYQSDQGVVSSWSITHTPRHQRTKRKRRGNGFALGRSVLQILFQFSNASPSLRGRDGNDQMIRLRSKASA